MKIIMKFTLSWRITNEKLTLIFGFHAGVVPFDRRSGTMDTNERLLLRSYSMPGGLSRERTAPISLPGLLRASIDWLTATQVGLNPAYREPMSLHLPSATRISLPGLQAPGSIFPPITAQAGFPPPSLRIVLSMLLPLAARISLRVPMAMVFIYRPTTAQAGLKSIPAWQTLMSCLLPSWAEISLQGRKGVFSFQ